MADNQVDLKFVVKSEDLTTANTKLDKMEGNLKSVGKVSSTTANQFKGAGKNLGYQFQNAGYQVQDFIVQVQGGQGAMRALSQQGSQLLGIFGPVGVFAGIGLSLTTSIIPALMQSTEEAEKLEDALKAAGEAADALEKNNLNMGLGGASQEVLALQRQVIDAENRILNLQTQSGGARDHNARIRDRSIEVAEEEIRANQEIIRDLNLQISQRRALEQLTGDQAQEAENLAVNEARERQVRVADDRIRLEYAKQIAMHNRVRGEGETDYNTILKNSNLSLGEMKEYLASASSESELIRKTMAGIADETARLAVQASYAAQALSGLQNIGVGLARNISAARAELQAFNTEANTTVARNIATRQFDLRQGLSDAIASGADRSAAVQAYIEGRQQITEYESLLLELDKRRSESSDAGAGTVGGSVGSGITDIDPMVGFIEQLELQRALVGVSEDRAEVIKALGLEYAAQNPSIVDGLATQVTLTRELIKAEEQRKELIATVESSLERSFMSMVDGTQSVKDAFKTMAAEIIRELYRVYVVQQLVSGITGSISLGGGTSSASTTSIRPQMRASGGTIMSNQPYLVGEKGPELIVPRNRGHVMNADLTSGAMGGASIVVHQTQQFQFAANGDDSVKRIIAGAMPAIVNASKQGVMDARRRGGSMKNTFG